YPLIQQIHDFRYQSIIGELSSPIGCTLYQVASRIMNPIRWLLRNTKSVSPLQSAIIFNTDNCVLESTGKCPSMFSTQEKTLLTSHGIFFLLSTANLNRDSMIPCSIKLSRASTPPMVIIMVNVINIFLLVSLSDDSNSLLNAIAASDSHNAFPYPL
ncbi:hypothetical protein GZH46_02911, partial [Fragariocoptes setiger]